MITERFGGEVPSAIADLRALPGVGSYTAAAIASFAYARRELVLDTNVRRVLHRVVLGAAFPPASSPPGTSSRVADRLAPRDPQRAARWAVASMELGAVVCLARMPRVCELPDSGSVRLAAGRLAGLDRTASTRAGVRGHRSAVSWRAARGAPQQR